MEMDEDTRLKLIGLKALADDHNRHMQDIERVALELFGIAKEEDEHGYVSDFVYDEAQTLADTLDKLNWFRQGKAFKAAGNG
jgi:hypothetical protein